ncbi:ABC transporter permease [Halobacteria archaeon AArc-dxtr1]|nr:ABC transporter permease [Halobacteria archaeon AArc-dxtr1]
MNVENTIGPDTLRSIVRREFKQTLKYKITLLLFVIGLLVTYVMLRQYGIGGSHAHRTSLLLETLGGNTTLAAVQSITGPFVFVTAFFLGYRAMSDERGQSLIVTASLPHSRLEIVLGKVLGRSLVVLVLTAIPVAIMLTAGIFWYGTPSPIRTVAFLVVTAGYAVSCVSIGVGLSALVRSGHVANLLAFVFLFVVFVWEAVLSWMAYHQLTGSKVPHSIRAETDPSSGYLLFQRLVPDSLYHVVTNPIIGAPNTSWHASTSVEAAAPRHTVLYVFPVEDVLHSTPFYLTSGAALLGMILWAVLPLGLGYLRFRKEEIQ